MAPFAPFEDKPALAVGVSGGRDSLALALLASEWALERGGRVLALIVDHGLRVASAGEATTTRELLAQHGIAAEILSWSGAKPLRGIQAAARAARYRLLFDACRRERIVHLLVAHHAADQGETIAMRAARDSGADGLAGMAALVEHGDVRLLRPLLGVSRARLTATLEARGVAWIDDPSNVDPRFERARLRVAETAMVDRPDEGAGRAAREAELARAAVEVLEFDLEGAVAIDRTAFGRLGRNLGHRLLSRVVQALGGRDHPPRRDRLAAAVARLSQDGDRGKSGKGRDFTLSACRLMLRQVSGSRRMRWIVRPESGKNDRKKAAQPLIPAAFFACGAASAPHVNCHLPQTDRTL